MAYSVAVDIGGTFTDLVAYDDESRSVVFTKSPTTYDNFVAGVLDCFTKAKLDPGAASFVNHGTTLVINALIQRKGAKAALLTTRGFRGSAVRAERDRLPVLHGAGRPKRSRRGSSLAIMPSSSASPGRDL